MGPHNLIAGCSLGFQRQAQRESRLCLERLAYFLEHCRLVPNNLEAGCSLGLQRQAQQKVDSAWKD